MMINTSGVNNPEQSAFKDFDDVKDSEEQDIKELREKLLEQRTQLEHKISFAQKQLKLIEN